MSEISVLLTLVGVHLIGLMSPGPDFALVMQTASRYGRKTGVLIAAGLTCGIFLHLTFTLSGISLLIKNHPLIFIEMQLVGASYLFYLGFCALKSTIKNWSLPAQLASNTGSQLQSKRQAFYKGFMTNILNPKAFIFFISLLSSFIPVGMSIAGKVSVVVLIGGVSFLWFASLAWVLTTRAMQKRMVGLTRYIDAVCGVVFMLASATIFWQAFSHM
ncbi:MAG: LysE family translocator [Enterovibrio sp.]